ncbi:FkbM family methyltransferase [Streptomyces sioyaensis]|uniref:FkbM family methyltransferase n=1 Tax=Streptomyces sioyaensis TaxID=67364 RepID=UPI0033E99CB4
MDIIHRLRSVAHRFGVDITRYPGNWSGLQLVRLLAEHRVNVVIDVGAHAGGYGSMLRSAGFPGRIVSFEPLRSPRSELHRAARKDEHWHVYPYALGEKSGTVVMNVAGNSGASSSVLPMLDRHRVAAPHAQYQGKQTAEMRCLGELWEELIKPDDRVFLKMDVQGYEENVLKGLGGHFGECVGIQMETSLVPLYQGVWSFKEALELVTGKLGMTVMSVIPGFTDPRTGQMLQCDLVLFRDVRVDVEQLSALSGNGPEILTGRASSSAGRGGLSRK